MAEVSGSACESAADPRRAERRIRVTDDEWMLEALTEADRAASLGEVPVGCVLVDAAGLKVASGYNLRETDHDPTAHAEIVAIRSAARARGTWRLEGHTLYVTLEPCVMCAGALVNARISRVVWGCDDPKAGACVTLFTIGQDARLNHRYTLTRGVLETECAERLKRFFASLRAQGKK
jgi:tRNA(adenine34) deaminase